MLNREAFTIPGKSLLICVFILSEAGTSSFIQCLHLFVWVPELLCAAPLVLLPRNSDLLPGLCGSWGQSSGKLLARNKKWKQTEFSLFSKGINILFIFVGTKTYPVTLTGASYWFLGSLDGSWLVYACAVKSVDAVAGEATSTLSRMTPVCSTCQHVTPLPRSENWALPKGADGYLSSPGHQWPFCDLARGKVRFCTSPF